MYKGLIENLTFVYSFICRGRGKLTAEDNQALATGAHTLVRTAPAVLGDEGAETGEDRADLALAGKIDEHIEEAVVFLGNLEIV